MTRLRTRSLAAALALLSAGIIVACATKPPAAKPAARAPIAPVPPPRDDDATPAEASPLTLGAQHADSLDRAHGDLDDWFKIDVPRAGTLTVIVEGPSGAALPNLTLAVTDSKGGTLATPSRSGGRPRVGFGPREVQRGSYLIWVGSEASEAGVVPYVVRSAFSAKLAPPPPPKPLPPPPPPKPRFETRSVRLVELSAGGQSATIGGGRADGLGIGMTGRLLNKGAPIAKLRVVEVYERGSRVQLDPPVAEAPSGAMSIEVDIPLP